MAMYVNNGSWVEVAKAYYKDTDNTWKLWYEPYVPPALEGPLMTISGQNNAWTQRVIDMAQYGGETGRLVFKYVSGSSYTGDIQLDQIRINGSYQSFENTGAGWETTTVDTPNYFMGSFASLTTGSTGMRWNVDSGGTGSSGTGRTDAANGSYYIYAETSSPGYSNKTFWLRSPEYTFTTSDIIFWEARYGATIGTLEVYLEI